MKIEIPKPLIWIGSSKKDLLDFPDEVRQIMGYALYLAQKGEKHQDTKPLKGFNGAKTLEVVEGYKGDTFRAVYTVKLDNIVYVLHSFKKKSKMGIKTPKPDMDLIKQRLKEAEQLHKERNT